MTAQIGREDIAGRFQGHCGDLLMRRVGVGLWTGIQNRLWEPSAEQVNLRVAAPVADWIREGGTGVRAGRAVAEEIGASLGSGLALRVNSQVYGKVWHPVWGATQRHIWEAVSERVLYVVCDRLGEGAPW